MTDRRGVGTDEPFMFRVLGPLEVTRAGRPVTISAARQRIALATLLLSPNAYVSQESLIKRIWGDAEPDNARGALYTRVTRLRQALDTTAGQPLIRTRSNGYVLHVEPGEVDLLRFRELTRQAASTAGPAQEADLLEQALALWRKPLLANVPSESVHRDDVPVLMEERLAAVERFVQLRLRCGRHDEMIVLLRQATAEHPFRERLWAQLMIALDRSGRRAEALEAYRTVIALLRDDLGIDPGRQLTQVHAEILADLPLDVAEVRRVRPRQLPVSHARFTGRTAALARLDDILRAGPAALAVVSGVPGAGKTTLAVHWANRVRDRFPDGQLYLDLRGSSPENRVEPVAALGMLLRSLDVPADRVPDEVEARSALLRSTLAGRRVLVLLDDAGDAAQVRPLLPNSESLVLVTSGNRLSGLAVDGAHHVVLGPLDADESVALLAELVGAEPGPAAGLAALCGHLPLALVLAAEYARLRPDVSLAELVRRFGAERTRLDLFEVGADAKSSLRAAFSRTYRSLVPAAARAFRLLGPYHRTGIDVDTAAALLGTSRADASRLVDLLAQRFLLEPTGHDRYGFHDLVGIYAAERATAEELHTAASPKAQRCPHQADGPHMTHGRRRAVANLGRPARSL